MTLEEKMRQMGYADCAQFAKNGKFSAELAKKFFKGLVPLSPTEGRCRFAASWSSNAATFSERTWIFARSGKLRSFSGDCVI